jgi:hypothetical protein
MGGPVVDEFFDWRAVLENTITEKQIISLEPMVICSSKRISETEIEVMPTASIRKNILNDILIDLRLDLLKEFIEPDVKNINIELEIPKTWFQHFKEDYFPKWLLEKFPVKYKGKTFCYKVSVDNIYPNLNLPPSIPYLKVTCQNCFRAEDKRSATVKIREKF